MAWDDIARQDHRRVCARYPSDMTDREWAIIAPLLPPARSGGRPRMVDLRAVMDAILFIASSGCQWRGPGGGPWGGWKEDPREIKRS